MHEQAYENNLLKIKHAGGKLAEIRDKIARYDADLKMSAAEAEMARLAQDFHVDVTTDFGQLESSIQEKIDLNRAKVRVAADLSGEGVEAIRQEQAAEGQLAEDALREFERQLEPSSAQAVPGIEPPDRLGPARTRVTEGALKSPRASKITLDLAKTYKDAVLQSPCLHDVRTGITLRYRVEGSRAGLHHRRLPSPSNGSSKRGT